MHRLAVVLAFLVALFVFPRSALADEYVVSPGDTLSSIAERFRTTPDQLARLNNLADPHSLQVGQVLSLAPSPASIPSSTPLAGVGGHYIVQPGDTLEAIAQRLGVPAERLAAANGLANPDQLIAGQDLLVPADGLALPLPSPAAASPAPARPTVSPVPSPTEPPPAAPDRRYVVQPGDTLGGIAYQLGVAESELAVLNGLTDPNHLPAGQSLLLPAGAKLEATPTPPVTPGPSVTPTSAPPPPPPTPTSTPTPTAAPPAPSPTPTSTAPPSPSATPAPPPAAGAETERYVVQPGDFLHGIARRLGLTLERILALNPIPDPNRLSVGQVLVLPTPTPSGQRAAEVARRLLGKGYSWGGHLPDGGFDCTGFVWYVYRQLGVSLPQHDLAGQMAVGKAVDWEALVPGDVLFFENTYQPGLSHVGIYVGDGRFVNALDEGSGVAESPLREGYWWSRRVAARRIFP